MSSLVHKNLTILTRTWRLGQSGVLRLVSTERVETNSCVVPVARGGLMSHEAWCPILENLASHVSSLEERPSEVTGNRRLMGALLATACSRYRVAPCDILSAAAAPPPERQSLSLMPAIALPPMHMLEAGFTDSPNLEQTALLARGRELLAKGLFEEADDVLSAARNLRMDHGPTLASLARARLNNRNRLVADRVQDAERMVKLARNLTPGDPEVDLAFRLVMDRGASTEPPTVRRDTTPTTRSRRT